MIDTGILNSFSTFLYEVLSNEIIEHIDVPYEIAKMHVTYLAWKYSDTF